MVPKRLLVMPKLPLTINGKLDKETLIIAQKLSKYTIIIVNSCGDAKKDRDILKQKLGKY